MTHRFPVVRVAAFVFVFAAAVVASPQTKRRAVKPGSGAPGAGSPAATVTLTGVVVDATTGHPVLAVEVSSGQRSGRTDANGQFAIAVVPGTDNPLRLARSGYDTLQTTINIQSNTSQTFRLNPKATVHVRMTSGATYELDTDTVDFGYVAPFSGYIKDTKLNLCKSGGDSFTPDRDDIKTITSAAQVTDTKCCSSGPIPGINVTLKAGGTTTAGFTDACFGYKVDIIAQDHTNAQPVYLHFADIAEVDFP